MEIQVEVILPDGTSKSGFVDADRAIEHVVGDIIKAFRIRASSETLSLHLVLDPKRTPRDYHLADGDTLILNTEPERPAFRPK